MLWWSVCCAWVVGGVCAWVGAGVGAGVVAGVGGGGRVCLFGCVCVGVLGSRVGVRVCACVCNSMRGGAWLLQGVCVCVCVCVRVRVRVRIQFFKKPNKQHIYIHSVSM